MATAAAAIRRAKTTQLVASEWPTPSTGSSSFVWPAWNQEYVATTAFTSCSQIIWPAWNLLYVDTSASTNIIYTATATDVDWVSWNNVYGEPTPEQLATEARHQARLVVELEELKKAGKRAEALLLRHLAPNQLHSYRELRYFDLITRNGARRYRLYKGYAGNIALIGPDGKEVERYCIHSDLRIPEADNLLAQKLMLEIEEERFLKIANRHPPRDIVPPAAGAVRVA